MQQHDYTERLLSFLHHCPTAFHAVDRVSQDLIDNGFQHLQEHELWGSLASGSYFVIRNNSSLIAFTLTDENLQESGLRMAGAHTDSPCLKVKPNPLKIRHSCVQVNVEIYGGALLAPWFDRDLSLAGRITYQKKNGHLCERLIDFKAPLAIIPSLAIHLDRDVNKNRTINQQTDIIPILSQSFSDATTPAFKDILLKQLSCQYPEIIEPDIIDYELFFYDSHPPSQVGLGQEFISGARLDNLISCFNLVQALIAGKGKQNCLVVLNDHEEVGSLSTSGAQGSFLRSVLERLQPDTAERQRVLSRSLLISADNAHAVHPNFAGKHDDDHLPTMNSGPVIKWNANQRYATNSRTAAFFRMLCKKADVPAQEFVMRNDMACGSTLGPLSAAEIGVATVDVGVPSLAMHSIREMAGINDCFSLEQALEVFFSLESDHNLWKSCWS